MRRLANPLVVVLTLFLTAGRGPTSRIAGLPSGGSLAIATHSIARGGNPGSGPCALCAPADTSGQWAPARDTTKIVAEFEAGVHGDVIECSDCHAAQIDRPSDDSTATVAPENISSTCATCHDDIGDDFFSSDHGRALRERVSVAPTCVTCHGEHAIYEVSDTLSIASQRNEAALCLSCHLDTPDVRALMTHSSAFISSYENSVHGRSVAGGSTEAAVCSDCHSAHGVRAASDPLSSVNKFRMASMCATCHAEEAGQFQKSIHGEALERGIEDAPTCTNCHGEHNILSPSDVDSPVAAGNISNQVCDPCHNSVKLSEKYGFPPDRGATFGDSYHGLAGEMGSRRVANCTSCHGVHEIRAAADSLSMVNKANLEETCGNCHPGANANFARGSVHVVRARQGEDVLYWIAAIYTRLIIIVIGLMALHNFIDWLRKLVEKQKTVVNPPPVTARSPGLYLRMTISERIQHALLAGSFIMLVFTGFMLKFPGAWWVRGVRYVVGADLVELRSLVHRIAAVIMTLTAVYHVYYVAFTQRGRTFMRDIMFRLSDFREVRQMVGFNLGFGNDRPRFDRFSYIEKSEYWALIWGTIIMTATGTVLWFENQFMSGTSKLFIDVNETIHYYEAWLAFLAIIVWHFYYVIFNPDVYPMNLTWLTGKISLDQMRREHPKEIDRAQPVGEIRDNRAPGDPSPEPE